MTSDRGDTAMTRGEGAARPVAEPAVARAGAVWVSDMRASVCFGGRGGRTGRGPVMPGTASTTDVDQLL
jgi:hypothetical protein